MDDTSARELAEELLKSTETSFSKTFTITNQGQESSEVIVVIAIQTNKRDGESLKKLSESIITKAVAGPYGRPCPMCSGTGKI
jgi:adenosylmethionine-8-amino-7-oxononanoate aminotransferase